MNHSEPSRFRMSITKFLRNQTNCFCVENTGKAQIQPRCAFAFNLQPSLRRNFVFMAKRRHQGALFLHRPVVNNHLSRGNGISPGHFLFKNGKQLTPTFPTSHPELLATKIEWLLPAPARFAADIGALPRSGAPGAASRARSGMQ